MSVAEFANRYRSIVIAGVILSMVWGAVTFFSMPRREDPEFTIRVCVITTEWPGAPAKKVEELITDKIEQQVISLEEVETIRSITRTGQSTIFVVVEDRIKPEEIQGVWEKVRARVENAKMPESSIRPVVNDEFGDTAVLVLALHQIPSMGRDEVRDQDRYSFRQLEVFADVIADDLRLLPGVARADKFGVRDEAIYIESDRSNWAQLDLTTSQLERLTAERNILKPGGQIDTDDGHFNIKIGGEFNAIDEIRNIASTVDVARGENQVHLSQLGLTVTRSYEDPPQYICRYGDVDRSAPAVCVAITMKSGANIVDVCQAAKNRTRELIEVEQRLPKDIAAIPVSDQSENVTAKINEVVVNVVEAVIIVVIVVYLVVGFRTSAVMAANIPVVVIGSLGIIALFGVQLEQISLAAMIISLGLLVDNAVQVCDQARSNQMDGMKPFEAAVAGANTLAIPMLVGTLTTIAAFFPMMFALTGGAKEYVYSLPVTVSTTLALSWVLAMTFCVLLAGWFIRVPQRNDEATGDARQTLSRQWPVRLLRLLLGRKIADEERSSDDSVDHQAASSRERKRPHENIFLRAYGFAGKLAIRRKWITVAATLVLSFAVLNLPVGSEFFPEAARDQFAVKIHLPETATVEQTSHIAEQVEQAIRKLSHVADAHDRIGDKGERLRCYRVMIGGGGSRWHLGWDPEPPTRNFAEILVRTTDGRYTSDYAERLRQVCTEGDEELGIEPIIGARIVPVQLALGPPADPLVLRVIGTGFADPDQLREVATKLKHIVDDYDETWNVNDSWGVNGFQVRVNVDKDRATLAGVTNSQVAESLNSSYTGMQLTTLREGDHLIPIYFRLRSDQRNSLDGLKQTFVEGDKGKIPLEAVADFEFSWELAKIQRRNMNRVIEVSSRVLPGVSGNDVVNRVINSDEFLDLERTLPVGYWIEPGGAYEESADAGVQMGTSFLASFVLIVICLICQYNGFAKPLIILGTLPLALVGAWMGLYLSDNSLGFMPQLGILALFGIVLNTAIIFIEFADILIDQKARARAADPDEQRGPIVGLTKEEFQDCLVSAGKQRMLPIFLTTATTVGGLIPLALTGGPLWVGLAWCMIAGLLFTTVLTLFFIPALYAIFVETFGMSPIALSLSETQETSNTESD